METIEGRVVSVRLNADYSKKLDILKDELSVNGAISISDGSAIKWLLQFYEQSKATADV